MNVLSRYIANLIGLFIGYIIKRCLGVQVDTKMFIFLFIFWSVVNIIRAIEKKNDVK